MENNPSNNREINCTNNSYCSILILCAGVIMLAVGSVCRGEFDAGTDQLMVVEHRTIFDQKAMANGSIATLSIGGEWYTASRYHRDPASEGSCEITAYDKHDVVFWQGNLGCTVHMSSVAGFFFSYNPLGDHTTEIYNLKVSSDPIAKPRCYPTEHAFSSDGKYVLLGGDGLRLFDDLGQRLFSYKVRLDQDVALAISANSSFIAVGDVVEEDTGVSDSISSRATDSYEQRERPTNQDSTGTRIRRHAKNGTSETAGGASGQRRKPDRIQKRRSRQSGPQQMVSVLTLTGQRLSEFPISKYANALAVSNDGALVAVASGAEVSLFTVDGDLKWSHVFSNYDNTVKAIAIGNDGTVAAVVNESRNREINERYVVAFDSDGQPEASGKITDRPALDIYDIRLVVGDDDISFADSKEQVTLRSMQD
ncbi:MAG: hypothetical protein V3V99_12500 [candidate division Zixibacteria bacterium]